MYCKLKKNNIGVRAVIKTAYSSFFIHICFWTLEILKEDYLLFAHYANVIVRRSYQLLNTVTARDHSAAPSWQIMCADHHLRNRTVVTHQQAVLCIYWSSAWWGFS